MRRLVGFSTLLALAAACSSADLKDNRVTGSDGGTIADDDGGLSSDGGVVRGDGGSAAKPPPSSANVTIIVEPSDNAGALLNAVKAAKKSVHVTMYLLSSNTFITALVNQKNAGHDVKVLLNKNFPDPGSSNQDAYNTLSSAGVSVAWAPAGYTYTHAKTVIIDGVQAWVMTMNVTFSSPQNREFLAIDNEANDVTELESIFADDFANRSHQTANYVLVSPVNARDRLKQLIDSAGSTLDVEGETLSDDTITNAIVAAWDRGVKVRVVVSDEDPTAAQVDSVNLLKQHKVPLVATSTPFIHAKAIVADGTYAYVGSMNFTTNSLMSNRELGVILSAKPEIAKVSSTIATDFANGKAL